MYDIAPTRILYTISIILSAYWLYRLYMLLKKKRKTFDDDYDNMLNAEKYKVKGKFES